eukprot:gnl/MRDRNA2_/MRDRNA2_104266_c0_seq1.p1 gnl/MRDRNA2_/MRDRNA2_104266_c0~~gnl/MRDRNA2_/MRDRNA2_104266_c0_seq1.p1  ORF type:complete len:450 (+),score=70.61 gnl/MRDRNA2_/MRDRNA2_104266_c0_seq1:79-1428(+)
MPRISTPQGVVVEAAGVVVEPKSISEYKFREEYVFSGPARLIFEGGVPWNDWETASVMGLKAALGNDNTWSDGELLRYIHLAGSYRCGGVSPTDYTSEDVVSAKELLQKSRSWKNENRPTWTPEIRKRFAKMAFYQGRDKRGRPLVILKPGREALDGKTGGQDFNKAIYAMIDQDIEQAFIPGVAEQGVWIIDLGEVRLSDTKRFSSSLQEMGKNLEVNWPSRLGVTYLFKLPMIVNAAINTAMWFVQKETQEKVQCFRGTLEKYPDILKENFDAEYFPVEYGGRAMMKCNGEPVPLSLSDSSDLSNSASHSALNHTGRSDVQYVPAAACTSLPPPIGRSAAACNSSPPPIGRSFADSSELMFQIRTQVRSGNLPSANLHQLRRDLNEYAGGSSGMLSGSLQQTPAVHGPDFYQPKGIYVSYREILLSILSMGLGTALAIMMTKRESCG